jgi:hypothetical protein
MRGSSLLALTALFAPVSAYAHVKWFADYDIASPPRPLIDVFLGEYFLAFIVILVPLMFAVAYLDRYLARANCLLYRLCARLTESVSGYFSVILRLGVGVFFTALFSYGEFILTPELKSQEAWVRWVQLAIAIFSLTRQSAWLAGAGIFLLYGFALVMYGLFHLSDYPIFLGVAIYLIIDSYYRGGKPELAQTVMRVAAGITLLWASIEKFAYPEWSFLLLSERPALSMGFNPEFYMVAAGFVEFCAAFLLITGMLSSRAAALVLLFFFVSAIVPFGMIDAIGHSVIIIVLALIAMSHNPVARRFDTQRGVFATATLHIGLFYATLLLFISAYYGGQYLGYQVGPDLIAETSAGVSEEPQMAVPLAVGMPVPGRSGVAFGGSPPVP